MQSLDEFMVEERERLTAFEAYWQEGHRVAPEVFPLAMNEGNDGQWFEQWSYFDVTTPMPVAADFAGIDTSPDDEDASATPSQTLPSFIAEMREHLVAFETYYRASHAIAPNAYPLRTEAGNEGVWFESLLAYNTGDPLPIPGELEPIPATFKPEDGTVAPVKRSRPRR